MKRSKPQTGFGATFKPDGWVAAWTIHGSASAVRDAVGRQWRKEDMVNGWKAAKIEGAKVVKVEIRIVSSRR